MKLPVTTNIKTHYNIMTKQTLRKIAHVASMAVFCTAFVALFCVSENAGAQIIWTLSWGAALVASSKVYSITK